MSPFVPDTEGVWFDLPEDVYRAAPGVNISSLKKMASSPAHYIAATSEDRPEPTPAQVLGTMLHRAALEPHRLADAFVVKPDGMTFTTKEGKAWRDAQTLPILDAKAFRAVRGCADSVSAHPIASHIIQGASKEVSIFKRHTATGLLLKGRADIVAEDDIGQTVIADIKTTADASPSGFPREMAKWGYEQQAAYYLDLLDARFFMFIAVEKEPPYAVAVYNLDAESIQIGRDKNERHIAKLAECIATGQWPAYTQEITTISLPKWARIAAVE